MLAIHDSQAGFNPLWVEYCSKQKIPHKLVDCYANDIVDQLKGSSALLWHHSQSNPRDLLIARQILSALEHTGLKVFPDFRTAWHFDDKVGQKYLFEALGIPTLPAYVFVDRARALSWAADTEFPKVFKLRHGAGSAGVRLVHNEAQARRLIKRAFGRGFSVYAPWENLKERFYKWRLGRYGTIELCKAAGRFVYPPRFSRILGRQRGYVYFQDFAPDNDSDIRVIVIGERAFGIKRWVRPGDFRASGSGSFSYDPEHIGAGCVSLAFETAKQLGSDCAAFDFVRKVDGSLAVLEISYGFDQKGYESCLGYWDIELNWHSGEFCPQGWIVELVLSNVRKLANSGDRSA